jgi:hypothetical protein
MGWIGARGAPQEALGTWAATGHWMEWMRLTSWLCVCVRSRLLGSVWIMTTTSREVVLFEPTFQPFLGCSPVPLFWVGPRTTPPGLEQAHVRTTQPSTRLRKSPTEAQSAIQRALVWMDQPDEERRRADGMDPSSPQNPRDPEGPETPERATNTPDERGETPRFGNRFVAARLRGCTAQGAGQPRHLGRSPRYCRDRGGTRSP